MKLKFIAAAALLAASTGPAAAYTSFVLPNDFSPEQEVTVQASYASSFFTPQIALGSDFTLIYPDGARGTFNRIEVQPTATTLRTDMPRHGTYRITTGDQLGPVTTLVGVDGQWRQLAAGETPPEGAETTTLQTVTLSESYISRGAPSRGAVDQTIGALALRPVTHPNQVLAANGFEVELRFNDQPFPNMPLVVYQAGDPDTDLETYFVTNEQGRATVTFPSAGNYVVAVRHRAPAPADSGAAVRSYTTTLTLEVITAIPDYPPAPEEAEERSRNGRRGLDRRR